MARQHSPTDDLQDLRAVLADPDLSTAERMVMVSLILHRNGKTGRCDPSTYAMAAEAGASRFTIMRAIERLEASGLITCDRRNGARTAYVVHPPTGSTEIPVAQSNRLQPDTIPVAHSNRTGSMVQPERTNTNEERTKEMWAVFQTEMDGARLTLTQARRKKLAALYSEQLDSEPDPTGTFRKILRAVKTSDHHMSNRDYQMPESLFKSPERRERWAEKARTNGEPGDPLMMTAEEVKRYGE
jgi:hypothetical protein